LPPFFISNSALRKKRYFRVILVTGEIRTPPFAISRAEFKEAPFLRAQIRVNRTPSSRQRKKIMETQRCGAVATADSG
jgi:hypothetical protein